MKISVPIVNAFIDGKTGGNPAGVILNSDEFNKEQKQLLAKKVGLSETAFVSRSTIADYKLEFFTPEKQIAHCGHATIAAFSYLSQQGLLSNANSSKETIDGIRQIELKDSMAFMEQLPPKYQEVEESVNDIYQTLGITQECGIGEPKIVNTGNSFLVIGVNSLKTLNHLVPDFEAIASYSEKYNLIGFYVFTLETNQVNRTASTRMFAPSYGIQEEAATGMAAGPLACYLHDHLAVKQSDMLIEQGYAMAQPSPSIIEVTLKLANNNITSLTAGGIGQVTESIEVDI